MNILVIRHGESLADVLNVHEGRADFELTDRGRLQANKLANYVSANFNVSRIYSSPLKRAKETAEILAKKTKASLILKDDLMEFNNGKLAGLSYDVADILYPSQDIAFDEAIYGMESMFDFHKRANRILNNILSSSKNTETIAIVSHGGMIKRLYMNYIELDMKARITYSSGDTAVHLWEITDTEHLIHYSNYSDHLKSE